MLLLNSNPTVFSEVFNLTAGFASDTVRSKFVYYDVGVDRVVISSFNIQANRSDELVARSSGSDVVEESSESECILKSRNEAIVILEKKISLTTPGKKAAEEHSFKYFAFSRSQSNGAIGMRRVGRFSGFADDNNCSMSPGRKKDTVIKGNVEGEKQRLKMIDRKLLQELY